MEKKIILRIAVAVLFFWFAIFAMIRIFSALKVDVLCDYVTEEVYFREYDEQREYIDEFLDDGFRNRDFRHYWFGHSNLSTWGVREFPSSQSFPDGYELIGEDEVKEEIPYVKKWAFWTYHDGESCVPGCDEYMEGVWFYRYEESMSIVDSCWFNVLGVYATENTVIFIIVLMLSLSFAVSCFKIYNDGKYEPSMASALSKSLSHELGAPLESLKELLENWKSAKEDARDEYSDQIISEIERMDDAIRLQLRIRDIEIGRLDMNLEETDLKRLTASVTEHIKPVLDKNRIRTELICDSSSEYMVMADPELLKLVIGNFITKSAEHSSGKIEIRLSGGKYSSFTVKSDDSWIDKEEAKNVWKDYSLYDELRADELGNLGLGLFPSAQILHAHKARFGCDALVNGTELWFEMKTLK